jgi:hypothetical protein
MANDPNNSTKSDSSFLGGGPQFNQAGLNTPLPGETTADAAPKPKYGGPKVWAGVIVVVLLVVVMWFVYANGPGGLLNKGGHGGISINGAPTDNPDTPDSSQ